MNQLILTKLNSFSPIQVAETTGSEPQIAFGWNPPEEPSFPLSLLILILEVYRVCALQSISRAWELTWYHVNEREAKGWGPNQGSARQAVSSALLAISYIPDRLLRTNCVDVTILKSVVTFLHSRPFTFSTTLLHATQMHAT